MSKKKMRRREWVNDDGLEIHGFTLKNGLGSDVFVGNALIPMYKECGSAVTARLLFDKMPGRDVVSWSTMIQVYCKRGMFDEALGVVQQMLGNSVKASEVSTISMANLLADIANVKLAKAMHAYVINNSGIVHFSTYLTNSLIDLYARSGDLALARWLFDGLVERGIVSYTANIVGYIRCKALEEGVKLFRHMIARGIWPNEDTLLSLITECGAVEALDLANSYMLIIERSDVMTWTALISAYAKRNCIDEAINLLVLMRNSSTKTNQFAACKVHRNFSLGEIATRELLEMDHANCGYNVLGSNMYATENRWSDVVGVRTSMKSKGVKKGPGFSCIEVNGSVHQFITRDDTHPQFQAINEMLGEMTRKLREASYKPDTSVVLLNVGEEEKEKSLRYHSEKIAIVFCLISTAPGTHIRVVKNLRVCDDCHNATKLLSKIYGR
ncbi:hypothetical protein Cgig2_019004 [Carnegiea gigantea]|uniref:DYW domain-containing protein n=1 Tax=Carnegiea gigantea TaxID=171969 RepID=A0A9Q1JMZ3_9CARY|nr:hypothetical protein Cgig2_019004 [Carnegiea gigantea]